MTKNQLHVLTRLCGIELFEANETRQSYGKHAHGSFAIGSIILGVGGYWCRGTHYVLPRHTLTLMNPDEPHTGYAVGSSLRYKMLRSRRSGGRAARSRATARIFGDQSH